MRSQIGNNAKGRRRKAKEGTDDGRIEKKRKERKEGWKEGRTREQIKKIKRECKGNGSQRKDETLSKMTDELKNKRPTIEVVNWM